MSAHGPAHAAAVDAARKLARAHEVDGLLVIAQRLRSERCWPMFRVGVTDETPQRVTFATSREHEAATSSPTLKEAIAKWIVIAERCPVQAEVR